MWVSLHRSFIAYKILKQSQATTGRSTTGTPLEVFRVERGQRYRFRLVNSVSHVCPVQLEVENHSLLVIASDSFDLQPVAVDSLVSNSGERYDFVLNANQTGGMWEIYLNVSICHFCFKSINYCRHFLDSSESSWALCSEATGAVRCLNVFAVINKQPTSGVPNKEISRLCSAVWQWKCEFTCSLARCWTKSNESLLFA